MAFNWKTFRTRTITAIFFAATMLVGLLWNHWSFLILFSIIHFGCWWEYLRLLEKIHGIIYHPYVKLGFLVAGYALVLWFCGPVYRVSGYGIKENLSLPVSAAGFVMLVLGIFQKTKVGLKSFGAAALGLLYISLSWGLLLHLYQFEAAIHVDDTMYITGGYIFPVLIVACMWINDTMAYIVGSLVGKRPLTKISPKKTWEGTIGGILLCVVAVFFLFPLAWFNSQETGMPYKYFGLLVIMPVALLAAVAGTFGDLLESKLKRMAGVKDSGTIMPGHGGFLDRFDSLLLAVPFVWLYIMFITTYIATA